MGLKSALGSQIQVLDIAMCTASLIFVSFQSCSLSIIRPRVPCDLLPVSKCGQLASISALEIAL